MGTFKVQFHDLGVEQQSEIRPRQCRAHEGTNGTHASPIRGDVHIDVAGAGAHWSVHVIQNGHTHLSCGFNEGWRCGMGIFWSADVDRAACSAPFIRAAFPILLTFEDWKHVGEGPTAGSVCRPPVVVRLRTAHPYHGIDTGTATKHVAEGHIEIAVVQPR
jgi:hypothetical protein